MENGSTIMMIIVVLFTLGIAFFVTNFFMNNVIYQMTHNNTVIMSSNATVDVLNDVNTKVVQRLDYVLFGCFIGIVLFCLLIAYFSANHPVLAIIYFLVLIVTVAVSAVMANIWEQVTSMSNFGTTISSFPITNHIILYLPYYATVIGFASLILMFVRSRVVNND